MRELLPVLSVFFAFLLYFLRRRCTSRPRDPQLQPAKFKAIRCLISYVSLK